MDLSPSGRIVLSYLEYEHLINGKQYVTFKDIVRNTGLSQRSARNAIMELRAKELVEAVLELEEGRYHKYRLLFKNLIDVLPEAPVKKGVYVIDIGIGTLSNMTFKMYRIIRGSTVVLYTPSVPRELLEYTKCTCALDLLTNYPLDKFSRLVDGIYNANGALSIVADLTMDNDLVKPYIDIAKSKMQLINVSTINPITIGINMLYMGKSDKFLVRRGGMDIRIIGSSEPVQVKDPLKVISIYRRGNEVVIGPPGGGDGFAIYIIYEKTREAEDRIRVPSQGDSQLI